MPGIIVENISKRYDAVTALTDISITVDNGEFMVMLGPSGCGKTTLLRCIAGLEQPHTGTVHLGQRCVYSAFAGIDVPPRERRIGMVFQNFALYPHMTVAENVSFGLRIRHVNKKQAEAIVREAIRVVDLEGFEKRRPRHLSGGQQQRVALARAIAANPEYLLFDEPLSNLDPKLRGMLCAQLKRIHRAIGATSVYVTHDQAEAMVLADRIAVLQNGRIAQIGSGKRIYRFPETAYVAEFTGNPKTNILKGEIRRGEDDVFFIPDADPYCVIPVTDELASLDGRYITLHVRPEDVEVVRKPTAEEGHLSVLAVDEGASGFGHLRLGDQLAQVLARTGPGKRLNVSRGQIVGVRFARGNVYEPESGEIIGSFGYGPEELGRLDESRWALQL